MVVVGHEDIVARVPYSDGVLLECRYRFTGDCKAVLGLHARRSR